MEGMEIEGRVVSITDYGAFVEVEQGIEGLVHISEMSWTEHVKHPTQKVQLGQTVNVKVLKVDEDSKKISLGMKQLEPDPWEGLLSGSRSDDHPWEGPQHHDVRRLRRGRAGHRRARPRLGPGPGRGA